MDISFYFSGDSRICSTRHENTALILWTCADFMACAVYSRITTKIHPIL